MNNQWNDECGTFVVESDNNLNLNRRTNKMATLGEEASKYEAPSTKNIADLKVVSTSFPVEERTGKDTEGKDFKYKVTIVDGEEYRTPNSVLASLKAIMDKKADLKEFSVSKTGSGMDTRYIVIPL